MNGPVSQMIRPIYFFPILKRRQHFVIYLLQNVYQHSNLTYFFTQ